MKYTVKRDSRYDFAGQSYSAKYPNLHRYPATMPPQIGIEILKELKINKGSLLDPYCGSGSSFASGLDVGLEEMYGFDINPLAVLISKAKFTKLDLDLVAVENKNIRHNLLRIIDNQDELNKLEVPLIKNIDFWYPQSAIKELTALKQVLYSIKDIDIRRLFLIPFAETVRESSYTRKSEFKLFRIKPEKLAIFKPDVFNLYFSKLKETLNIYNLVYYPKLSDKVKINVEYKKFVPQKEYYDVVLTSPPYGDSKTTVAYGQFSNFANEWLDIDYARQIDNMLIGGKVDKQKYKNGLITDYIESIAKICEKRSYEVSAFYRDLGASIKTVADSIQKGGYSIYVVGNRTVKNVLLPTDQFIAEKFESFGFEHIITYERLLSNKTMPSKNSPSNVKGAKSNTMLTEYIVVCRKK